MAKGLIDSFSKERQSNAANASDLLDGEAILNDEAAR